MVYLNTLKSNSVAFVTEMSEVLSLMSNFLLLVIISRRHLQHFVIVQIHIPGEMESLHGFLEKVNFTYKIIYLFLTILKSY